MSGWEAFDYFEMARQAGREREALRAMLDRRKAQLAERKRKGTVSPEEELRRKRDDSMLYEMYLEQRHNEALFYRRAEERRKGGRA